MYRVRQFIIRISPPAMPHSTDSAPRQSRRTFVRTAALTLGLSPFLPWKTGPRPAPAFPLLPDDEKLGIALVGLGNYATNQLAPALEQSALCKLTGIVTGTPAKATEWQQRHPHLAGHVYDYTTFDRIADDEAIDIVYIVLPNSMHAEYTIRAAQAGKHVICEKPMAVSVAEAQSMIDACEAAQRKLSIGYRLHFDPFNLEAKRLGQEKVFGPVHIVQSEFGFRIGNPSQWRLKKALAGGGAMMDVGIYCIQAARYVTGEEPILVTAQEFKTDPVKFAEVDETITWQLTFPSGCIASSVTSYATGLQRLYATAQRGWFELRPSYMYDGLRGTTSEGPMDFPEINQQAAQMDAFADCVRNDRTSTVDGYEGLRDMRVIEAIYKSIETGAPVSLA